MFPGTRLLTAVCLTLALLPGHASAWGGRGHRVVAAIAMALIPDKAADMNLVLQQLETDSNFVDAASYPDEFLRRQSHSFDEWHYADLPDDNAPFICNECLLNALDKNLAVLRKGRRDMDDAVAIAWVIHLVGDLHQPLHMTGRDRGGNNFHVTYRGAGLCHGFAGERVRVELHSAWDDCLVEELAQGRDPRTMARDILGGITSVTGRPEVLPQAAQPWLAWGQDSHVLAKSVAFGSLSQGDDLDDDYIIGPGKALDTVQSQLLKAGIRLAFLLDQNFR